MSSTTSSTTSSAGIDGGVPLPRLSSPLTALEPRYDVVVVGSGYGGAITASRLARAGQRVCLLERGAEVQPGSYPDTMREAAGQLQVHQGSRRLGNRTGLYDVHVGEEISVLKGCGLGGTSLINANVALEADPAVFADEAKWPAEVLADLDGRIAEGHERAKEMLGSQPLPDELTPLKLAALESSASAFTDATFYRPPINVTFADGPNAAGVLQNACTGCGNCVSGCNYHAKNTLLMNYLPDAVAHGARIYTLVEVHHLEPAGDGWVLQCRLPGSGREDYGDPYLPVSAGMVVLAAGTLGSTAILLRSREHVELSPTLGQGFTGNGDVLGFSYNGDSRVAGIGWDDRLRTEYVGATITGIIDNRAAGGLANGMVIEDGAVPGPLAGTLPLALAAAATAIGTDTDAGDWLAEARQVIASLQGDPSVGATGNTQTFLVMSHDDGEGTVAQAGDEVVVDWPGVGDQPLFDAVNDRLTAATVPLGGTFVRNPAWTGVLGNDLVTVHPLGGCAMSGDAAGGVVNHKGQVFSGTAGSEVYPDLYVSDGAVVPRPLGVNPLLTISGLAERCAALIAEDRGWTIEYDGVVPPPVAPPAPVQLVFTETMKGWIDAVDDGVDDPPIETYLAAEASGKAKGQECSFLVSVVGDIPFFFDDRDHPAPFLGSATASMLAGSPFSATDGLFNLFMPNPTEPNTQNMRYQTALRGLDGTSFRLSGYKVMSDEPGLDTWPDTTTLYTTIREGLDGSGPIVARGVLHVSAVDLATQIAGLQVWNTESLAVRARVKADFIRLFLGNLADLYLPGVSG